MAERRNAIESLTRARRLRQELVMHEDEAQIAYGAIRQRALDDSERYADGL